MKASIGAAILLLTHSSNSNGVAMAFTSTIPHLRNQHNFLQRDTHQHQKPLPYQHQASSFSNTVRLSSSTTFSSSSSSSQSVSSSPISPEQINEATKTLQHYDSLQQTYINQNPVGLGGGTSALTFLRTQLTPTDRNVIRSSLQTLVDAASYQRALDPSQGRIMLGFCAENVPEAMLGLKSWIPTLGLPRGLLHGLDVDGEPIEPETLGCVYVKYNTGGSMTFREMRESGMGFDALWKPGDAVLQTYDGDFRGVYFNVELDDGEFRQFGVLPTDLFVEEEEW